MRNYTQLEAEITLNDDINWLQRAGFMSATGDLTGAYDLLMQGKLNLPVDTEISILRRLERLQSLSTWLDWLETSKAKFKS